jgi:hypothetical protein
MLFPPACDLLVFLAARMTSNLTMTALRTRDRSTTPRTYVMSWSSLKAGELGQYNKAVRELGRGLVGEFIVFVCEDEEEPGEEEPG